MRDGDPHKLVPISEMFERFTELFELIVDELQALPGTSADIVTMHKHVYALRDIMRKSKS